NIIGVLDQRTTDASGVATLNINLSPGTDIITAQYGYSVVSNKITVLTIIQSSDISMKYKDGTAFKARILNDVGKVSPGVNVTFNINGVFYIRTTDASGVAGLNINLLPGEYIITTMYKGLYASNWIRIRGI
ncbi:MAG: adhesin, partial [Methanobrevibacter sp.]|nr:adhesin [Methanobrevibacter sp.]